MGFSWIFPWKPSSSWGTPMTSWKPPIPKTAMGNPLQLELCHFPASHPTMVSAAPFEAPGKTWCGWTPRAPSATFAWRLRTTSPLGSRAMAARQICGVYQVHHANLGLLVSIRMGWLSTENLWCFFHDGFYQEESPKSSPKSGWIPYTSWLSRY